ncbi:MAG: hypothetical protein ACI85N_000799 [Gammaproteobacteria bacterium]|jgi:hypothetical protein
MRRHLEVPTVGKNVLESSFIKYKLRFSAWHPAPLCIHAVVRAEPRLMYRKYGIPILQEHKIGENKIPIREKLFT